LKASGAEGVWLLNAEGAGLVFKSVQVVATDDASVQVTGLEAGSRVVSAGAQKLDAGMRVRAIERAPEGSPAAVAGSSS
jgi:hypothetical protein